MKFDINNCKIIKNYSENFQELSPINISNDKKAIFKKCGLETS